MYARCYVLFCEKFLPRFGFGFRFGFGDFLDSDSVDHYFEDFWPQVQLGCMGYFYLSILTKKFNLYDFSTYTIIVHKIKEIGNKNPYALVFVTQGVLSLVLEFVWNVQ